MRVQVARARRRGGPGRKASRGLELTVFGSLPKLWGHALKATFPRSGAPDQETHLHMKSLTLRLVAAAVAIVIAAALLGASAPKSTSKALEPGKLIVLSTTDVKGKNEPCG